MKLINLSGIFFGVALLFSQAGLSEGVEYKVKAGYLYNFTKFITWPEDTAETFNICIVGDDPFGDVIDPIEQQTAFRRPIKLFRFEGANEKQLCHIVFISAAIKDKSLLKSFLTAHNTLTVSESEAFARQGGMIGFINRQGNIKLQINLKLLQQSDLKISAKLLEVAELVEAENHD